MFEFRRRDHGAGRALAGCSTPPGSPEWPSSSRSTPGRPACARSPSTSAGARARYAYREFTQHFPRPGWVEHDPREIWRRGVRHARRGGRRRSTADRSAAIGITNQRETTSWCGIARTGAPRAPRLVWQDRRTAAALRRRCRPPATSRSSARRTGLVLDPYFSATKLEWLLTEGGVERRRRPRVRHRRLVDPVEPHRRTAAACTPPNRRTRAARCSSTSTRCDVVADELLDAVRRPRARACPTCRRRSGRFGIDRARRGRRALRVPVSGIAGDQQAALFGQACFTPGMTQEHLRHRLVRAREPRVDSHPPPSTACSPPWRGRSASVTTYALEGIDLRDRRRHPVAARRARDRRRRRRTRPRSPRACRDTDGVVFVPAFTGLGSPYWDPHARGARARPHARHRHARTSSRAAVEAMAWQTADVVDAITAASRHRRRPSCASTAAPARWTCCASSRPTCSASPCGDRSCARPPRSAPPSSPGIAEGVWSSPEEAASAWREDAAFAPRRSPTVERRRADWHRGVDRARNWVDDA